MNFLENGIYKHMSDLETMKEKMVGRLIEEERQSNSTSILKFFSKNQFRVIQLKELLRGVFLLLFSGIIFSAFILLFESYFKNNLSKVSLNNQLY